MQYDAETPDDFVAGLPEDRKIAISSLREVIGKNLPQGFKETMGYGHMGWVIPHETYPAGYHCDPTQPLPFMGIASQKNFIAIYHMAIYADPSLLEWFQSEWPKHSKRKLDMGKSCIRIKNPADLPLDLIAELSTKLTPAQWIELYERTMKR